jgi:hypothetical protein
VPAERRVLRSAVATGVGATALTWAGLGAGRSRSGVAPANGDLGLWLLLSSRTVLAARLALTEGS